MFYVKNTRKVGKKRPIHSLSQPPSQNPVYKTSIDVKQIDKYKGSVLHFYNMLGARNSSQTDEFFTRGRHENIDVFYLARVSL